MFQVSPGVLSRYKRRKVSAIRQFPRGCGYNAVKLNPKPPDVLSSPAGLQNGKVTELDMVLVPSNVSEGTISPSPALEKETQYASGSAEAVILPLPEPLISSTPHILEGKMLITTTDVNSDQSENKVELNPETLKQVEKNNDLLEINIDSKPLNMKHEVKLEMDESAERHKLPSGHCLSKLYGRPKRRKTSAIRQFPPLCGPNAGNIKKVKSQPVLTAPTYLNDRNFVREEIDEVRKHLVGDSSEKDENSRFVDMKKFGLTKGKEIAVDENVLVRSKSDKNFRVQGISSHTQLTKSGVYDGLVCTSSDWALDACKIDQTATNIRTKTNASKISPLVVKSKPGKKLMDGKGKLLMNKLNEKEVEINQNSSKTKPGEFPYNDYVEGESDDSFAANDDRMLVQAMKSSINCPWRTSKKSIASSSSSIASKNKSSMVKRVVIKNHTSKDFPSIQKKSKHIIGDDDDDDMLDEENGLSITMTPFAPPKSSQNGADKEVAARNKVKRALRLFQLICRKILQGEESNAKRMGKARIDLQAASILKDSHEWVNSGKAVLGHVPGVEIGDEFHFRVELSIVGLHRPFQGGIDFLKKNGVPLATSIVASSGNMDDMDSSDVLIYSGAGGTSSVKGDKQAGDQKLERGNLALKNSIDAQTPVRVIHGFKEKGNDPHDARGKLVSTFTYDGLYQVESYWKEVGSNGFNVFKFQLRRKPGQPELALKELKRSAKLKNREGLCIKDISQGKEKIQISVVNTIDSDQPKPFKYITKNRFPSSYVKTPPKGCDCINGCSDSEKCTCAVKNGGEIPYNFGGAIVQAKPLIYECGSSCKCSSLCHNRVSQRGIRIQLEIFKTIGRGWGVRSLKSIPSGSFICEYVGELLQDGDAEKRANDEYLFDIGHNYDDRSLWEGLPNIIPGLLTSSECDTVDNVGFTIDAAEYGNIGRFINHSCSPNLYAQNVLYDHDDKRMPHIMFFAVDNIPPLQELTYHYNYTLDQVRDSDGNVKQKACYCGSPECCGRLY